MKKEVTLKKNHEFQRMYRKGKSAAGSCMVLYCRKNGLGRNRLGLTASVKLGSAVVRNRCRRRMREVYRLHTPALKTGWDIIMVARGRLVGAPWKEVTDTFLRLCRKLDLLEDEPC